MSCENISRVLISPIRYFDVWLEVIHKWRVVSFHLKINQLGLHTNAEEDRKRLTSFECSSLYNCHMFGFFATPGEYSPIRGHKVFLGRLIWMWHHDFLYFPTITTVLQYLPILHLIYKNKKDSCKRNDFGEQENNVESNWFCGFLRSPFGFLRRFLLFLHKK